MVRLQNVPAWLVCAVSRFDHITPSLINLHWLRVTRRIEFKVVMLVHKCIYGVTPQYLLDLTTWFVSNLKHFWSATFSSWGAALLFVSTKNCDLWPAPIFSPRFSDFRSFYAHLAFNTVVTACLSFWRAASRACCVTYEIKCQTCGQQYVGETARSAFTRGKEHLDGMDRAVSQSVWKRHANDCHNGVIPDYVMNVTGVYHGDAMLRQITEAIKIRREGCINNKTEWNTITLPQAAIVK